MVGAEAQKRPVDVSTAVQVVKLEPTPGSMLALENSWVRNWVVLTGDVYIISIVNDEICPNDGCSNNEYTKIDDN